MRWSILRLSLLLIYLTSLEHLDVPGTLLMDGLVSSSEQPDEADAIMSHVSHVRKLSFTEVKRLAQDHPDMN